MPGRSAWYARLAFERGIFDELDRLADPDAPERFARMEQHAMTEFGQRFWWKSRRPVPERALNVGAVAP